MVGSASVAASGAQAAARAARVADVIVIGGGVGGSALGHDLARLGLTVEIVEKFGADASRRNLLNLAPAVGDRLAGLDNGTGEITRALVPIQQFRFADEVSGGVPRIRAGSDFFHEQNLRPGLRGLMDGLVTPPEDPRLWSRARIEEVEDALRRSAERRYGPTGTGQVRFHYDSQPTTINGVAIPGTATASAPVGGLEGAQSGLLELLPRGRETVQVQVRNAATGAEQALEGRFLVYATGGRNPLGVPKTLDADVMHFVGGEFPAADLPVVANRVRAWSDDIPGVVDRRVNAARMPITTIGLTYPKDRSIVWAQLAHDAKTVDPADLKAILQERAGLVGMPGEVLGDPIPVRVQLGRAHRAAFPEHRIMLLGDELGPPYFPTSSGAAKAIAVDAPLAADALAAASKPGADVAAIFARYEREAMQARDQVLDISRKQVHHDLHAVASELPLDLPRTGAPGSVPAAATGA